MIDETRIVEISMARVTAVLSTCSLLAQIVSASAATPLPLPLPTVPKPAVPTAPKPIVLPKPVHPPGLNPGALHPGSPSIATHPPVPPHDTKVGGDHVPHPHLALPNGQPSNPPRTHIGTLGTPGSNGGALPNRGGPNGRGGLFPHPGPLTHQPIQTTLVAPPSGSPSLRPGTKGGPETTPPLPASVLGRPTVGLSVAAPQTASTTVAALTPPPAGSKSTGSLPQVSGATTTTPTLPPTQPKLTLVSPTTGQPITTTASPTLVVNTSTPQIIIGAPINIGNGQVLTLSGGQINLGGGTTGGQMTVQVPSTPTKPGNTTSGQINITLPTNTAAPTATAVTDPMSGVAKPAVTPIPTSTSGTGLLGASGNWMVPMPTMTISNQATSTIPMPMTQSKTAPTNEQIADYYTKAFAGYSAGQLQIAQMNMGQYGGTASTIATAVIKNLQATQTYVGQIYSKYGAMSTGDLQALAAAKPNTVDGLIAANVASQKATIAANTPMFAPIQVINDPSPPPSNKSPVCFKYSMGCLLEPTTPPPALQQAETILAAAVVVPVTLASAWAVVAPALVVSGAAIAGGAAVSATVGAAGLGAGSALTAQSVIGFLS